MQQQKFLGTLMAWHPAFVKLWLIWSLSTSTIHTMYIIYGISSCEVSEDHEKQQICSIFWKAFTHEIIQVPLNYAGRQTWCCALIQTSFMKLRQWPTWCTLVYFTICLLYSSACFKHYILIIRRLNWIAAASGIVLSVSGRPVHRLRENCSAS